MLPYPADWYFKKFKAKFEKMYPGTEAQFVTIAFPIKSGKHLSSGIMATKLSLPKNLFIYLPLNYFNYESKISFTIYTIPVIS